MKRNVGVESPNPAQMKGNKPAFSYSEPKVAEGGWGGDRPVSRPVRLRPNTIKDQLSAISKMADFYKPLFYCKVLSLCKVLQLNISK